MAVNSGWRGAAFRSPSPGPFRSPGASTVANELRYSCGRLVSGQHDAERSAIHTGAQIHVSFEAYAAVSCRRGLGGPQLRPMMS